MKAPITKIEAAVSREDSRYVLRAVLYDIEKKALVATDGHILAFVPHEPQKGDVTCLIPLRALQAIRELQHDAQIDLKNGNVTVRGGAEEHTFPAVEGQFPRYESLLPKPDAKYKARISFTLERLNLLSEALRVTDDRQQGKITLEINGEGDAVVVRNPANPTAVGLLMPERA